MGHSDSKTTQIYSHYQPSSHEIAMVNDAFGEAAAEGADDASQDPDAAAGGREETST